MLSMAIKYWNTIKYLKLKQIYFQIHYKLKRRIRSSLDIKYSLSLPHDSYPLNLNTSIPFPCLYQKKIFTFLNLSKEFSDKIDWEFADYGKLWTYNLNYFDFLNQINISNKVGIALIYDFINNLEDNKTALEPYPISLRCINWIKFISEFRIQNSEFNFSLFAQLTILSNNLEYHLLGNHLLENGFALLFGAYYFKNENLYRKAKKIVLTELNEQVFEDGAHFELSPMYHQIILFRLLDCINLIKKNNWKKRELLDFLTSKTEKMLIWLNKITFSNGEIPCVNDSVPGIAPTTKQLNDYAKKLDVGSKTIDYRKINNIRELTEDNRQHNSSKSNGYSLGNSGYRMIQKGNYELFIDVGNIGPDYIPGHAHSDTFNFILYVKGKPVIVDTGISTYEKNNLRQAERSTKSHNTVVLNDEEQSQIWSGFRVAKRAKIIELKESNEFIEASHNGYKKKLNAIHKRRFEYLDNEINIIDTIISSKEHMGEMFLHFHPDTKIDISCNIMKVEDITISVEHANKIEIKNYNYSLGFNKLVPAKIIVILFSKEIKTTICVNQ